MDIKELLNLAKDNQSYHQKKFERDQLLKNKKKNDNDVSGAAVKAFLAKKQETERKAKAAEDAARRKRIEERLQASQGKSKPSANSKNPQASDGLKKGISEKRNPKYEELRRQNLKHMQKPTTEKEHKVSKAERREHRVSKVEKSSNKVRGRQSSTAKKALSKMDFKDLMKVAKGQADHKPELPVKKEYKQHRRKRGKEGDFEWSGARSTLESNAGDSVSQKAEKEYLSKAERSRETEGNGKRKLKTAKKAASTINFKDLLNVAKQQANKPTSVVQKKDIAIRKEAEGSQQAIAKRRDGGFGKHASKRSPEPQRKNRYVDINSVRVNNKVEHSSKRPEKPTGVPKSGGCKLVTRTIDNKRNYDLEGPRMSSGNAQQRNGGQGTYGNRNGMKRSKVESIDDELERERRELEKRRNMLKRKMQGLPQDEMSDFSEYSEDDYDEEDDMADFIDDGGEETDYSKHIRSIFGYDRRKFRDDDDDDLATMEASYSQIAAEESRSARIAKLEDEIERRREEMELRKAKKRR